ncbi:hypothetical protein CO115_02585 [Candidatus Falkowbacteria bacterium CG_4_9_14_3_um_filter_36_9]|uniref:Glycosyl transferase family 1 domain-containing protein n=2 Tax=Candidatus Falkowiibacteriota TaxID=1752728 RepID=A0A1J4TA93_9BACT|nr:MAG: hypothetical protein AUJ27_00280 [Candidatus Falkowbacteria bacterium CG1_02_37_44]PIV50755.1 MAG: hypothetical protein COS18_03925 [Candidatus Falkowbacteria bacterium CG02_land_8_20_14_3_00_36_14]PIX11947.1 MAG: hypothetical protein COZ73_01385 [Candidatus Falkowbacteria bacterium CG_4_8_14_3_um_filter_36_11]PJA10540.1 MAG: hypothetical protein COX67_04370 [Candidatus Falkowbacteria bacterium CG_4_10_14_0_2_um_filter_36_22]PJB19608.1 MAG: hypothetical protein CO115_02585 [Candidatus F
MKLLILTQKVDINDDLLGFMHDWILKFAEHCSSVVVICLEKGEYKLPINVRILSLGKEEVGGCNLKIWKRFIYLVRFYKYIWSERGNYDAIFTHMNKEYIILGWALWELWGKKIGLWYAHGYAPLSLKIAEKLTDFIFTSTKSGCRLKSNKINIIGQGINVNKFKVSGKEVNKGEKFQIISVGRISPSKNYETLIAAIEVLISNNFKMQVDIIGDVGIKEQQQYFNDLKEIIKDKFLDESIKFLGSVPNKDVVNFLQNADLFVNMSYTGSLDKAVLEAMACEVPVLTCNEAFEEIMGKYKKILMYPKKDYKQLAEKIKFIISTSSEERHIIGVDLRSIVVDNHSSEQLINKIISFYNFDKLL